MVFVHAGTFAFGDALRLASSHLDGISTNSGRLPLFAFTEALPIAFLGLVAVVDFFQVTGFARVSCVVKITNTLCRPFRQFLVLDDLAQFDRASAPRLEPSRWKKIVIIVSFIFQVVLSVGQVGVVLAQKPDLSILLSSAAVCISWVSALSSDH